MEGVGGRWSFFGGFFSEILGTSFFLEVVRPVDCFFGGGVTLDGEICLGADADFLLLDFYYGGFLAFWSFGLEVWEPVGEFFCSLKDY